MHNEISFDECLGLLIDLGVPSGKLSSLIDKPQSETDDMFYDFPTFLLLFASVTEMAKNASEGGKRELWIPTVGEGWIEVILHSL